MSAGEICNRRLKDKGAVQVILDGPPVFIGFQLIPRLPAPH